MCYFVSGRDTHFVHVFATYPATICLRFSKHLLILFTMASKDTFNAVEHYDNVEYDLSVQGKILANVVAIIGDNKATITASAR